MKDPIVVAREIVIARPPETVFGYVVDFRNDPKWRDEVERVEQPVPLRPGDMREILRVVMPDLPSSGEIAAWFGGTVEQFLATLKRLLEE
jgi:hypothetical protein